MSSEKMAINEMICEWGEEANAYIRRLSCLQYECMELANSLRLALAHLLALEKFWERAHSRGDGSEQEYRKQMDEVTPTLNELIHMAIALLPKEDKPVEETYLDE